MKFEKKKAWREHRKHSKLSVSGVSTSGVTMSSSLMPFLWEKMMMTMMKVSNKKKTALLAVKEVATKNREKKKSDSEKQKKDVLFS